MRRHRIYPLLLLSLIFFSVVAIGSDGILGEGSESLPLRDKKWIHGSADCSVNQDPAIEVFRYAPGSYILRQNKCLSFEAPFIYVLVGTQRVLVLDTGATKSALAFPLYATVRKLVDAEQGAGRELVVAHSHSHNDHQAGDSQFIGQPMVTLVPPNQSALIEYFAFNDWPNEHVYLDLGDRRLVVVPTPGHQEDAISIYDPQTGWLLTGDTLYPGRIYVKHWQEYKKSIARLASLLETREISAVLGGHIEKTNEAGEFYPIGATYQPHEASLSLPAASITTLDLALNQAANAQTITADDFVVQPMGLVQKTISNILRWFVR